MKKMLLVLGLLFIGCRVLEPTDVVETSQESLMRSESVAGCKLAIVPDLPLMDGDSCPNYIFYVPHGTIWDEIRIPISYIAPARSLVEWNINWVQIPRELPPFHSYPNPRCRGEIEILIRPSYVGWSVSITADIGSEFDAIILTVLEENTIGEDGNE
jgi:hypothetical protein